MNRPVFNIFSWNNPFLPKLKDFLLRLTDNEPGKAVIITPNRRPARYLTHLFARDKYSGIMPRMITIGDLVELWRAANTEAPLRVASALDQAALLYECVQEVSQQNPALAKHFGNRDMTAFLPWAFRLAKVLEDFYVAGRPLDNLPNLEGEVSAPAASILASLRLLGDAFTARLERLNWTTQGYDHVLAVKNVKNIPRLLQPEPDRPVIIAGFYLPENTHEILLKELWDNGAHICLHTDPALAEGGKIAQAAKYHQKWLKRWNASPVLYGAQEMETVKPELGFFAGYDLHSQLARVNDILERDAEKPAAIILGKPETLMATLQNLPPVNINVSMGYPMERTPLAQFLEDLLAVCQNRKDEESFASEKVLKVLRHPFMAMAKFEQDGQSFSLAPSLRKLDYEIRNSGRYWRPFAAVPKEAELAREQLEYLVQLFSGLSTLEELGESVKKLVNWLADHAVRPWPERLKLDAEALYRMGNEIVPALENNLLAKEKFGLPVLVDIFRDLVKEQRIPFDADPIEGVQVMGLLESRLLHFDRVIFLDATDDVLPGTTALDPLLPDYLRFLLDLPNNERREALAAYNVRRLAAGAGQVNFLWQEGEGGADEGKRIRSRFMEQMLWEKEKASPDIVKNNVSIVERPVASLRTRVKEDRPIKRSPALDVAIASFWANPVSPTSLDNYLACPAAFIRSHVLGLDEHDRSAPGPALVVGNAVHAILGDVYGPAGHMEIRGENDEEEFEDRVKSSFDKLTQAENLAEKLPPDTFLAIRETIPLLLGDYRKNQPASTMIVELEQTLAADLDLNGKKFSFRGKFDRLDQRNGKLYLTDYKTGKPAAINSGFWENDQFFDEVEKACQANDFPEIDRLFNEMREQIQSIQLPLYLLLLSKSGYLEKWGNPANASLVYLRGSACEENIFETDLDGLDDRRLDHCLRAIGLIEAHMRLAPEYGPENAYGKACDYCGFSAMCRN